MKIKIIILLTFFLIPLNVYGETIIKNKCYKEEKEYVGYLTKEENNGNYELYGDVKKEYGEWKSYSEEINENENIEINNVYTYKNFAKIKYIFIREVDVYSIPLNIDEIEIFNKNELINYTTMCYGCKPYNLEYFNNNNFENSVGIIRNGSLVITLDKDYNPWDISLKIYFTNTNNEKFLVWLSEYNSASKQPLLEYKETLEKNNDKFIKEYEFNETMVKNYVYSEEEFETTYAIDNWYTKLVKTEKFYRNIINKYNYYKINNVYFDENYYEECPIGYIKDNYSYISVKSDDNIQKNERITAVDKELEQIINNNEAFNKKDYSSKRINTNNTNLKVNTYKNNDIKKKGKDDNTKTKITNNKTTKSTKKGSGTMSIMLTILLLGLTALVIKVKL